MNGKVKCELLNVRKTPEKADNIVAVVTKGTELLVVDDANGWLRINSGNVDGYVMAEFVAIEAEPAPVAGQEPEKTPETDQAAGQAPEGTPEQGQADAEEPEKPKKSRKKGGEEDEQTGAAE